MDKKFEMKVILFENDTMGIAMKSCASGADIAKVLSETINSVIEKLSSDEAVRDYFCSLSNQ